MRHQFLTILLVGLFVLPGCNSDEPKPENNSYQPIETSRSQSDIVMAQNDFAFRLFNKSMKNGNNVISPLSVSMAMSMAANGAKGDTYEEISKVLGFEGMSIDDVNSLNRLLCERLPIADKNTRLSIANSMWLDNGFPVLKTFKDGVSASYDAHIENLDLASPKSLNRINNWVSDNTYGEIPKFFSGESPHGADACMLLINTLYFKSIWSNPFSKQDTKKWEFRNESGGSSSVRMMVSGEDGYPATVDDDGSCIVKMSYGNGSFMMTAVLPPEGMRISDYVSTIDSHTIERWDDIFKANKDVGNVKVEMPRFTVESEIRLIPVLESMGIRNAFIKDYADFSGMSEEQVFIMDALQKAKIEVDEDGVKAVAVTDVEFGYTSSRPPINTVIKFDRPFFYIISERSTGAILFVGNVSELI